MANQKITDDTAVVTPGGTDVLPVVQAGVNKKMTLTQIADFAGGATPFRNYTINGDFDIWQRGVSATATGYLSDRWIETITGSTVTATRQLFAAGISDVPDNPKYYHRADVTTGGAAGDIVTTRQSIENVRNFSGETITLSFYAKADAGKDIVTSFRQYFGSGGSPSSEVVVDVTTHTLTTSWQKFEVQIVVPSISGKTIGTSLTDNLRLEFIYEAGSSYINVNSIGNQSGVFDISHVQVERNSTATTFEQRDIGTELFLCQRYFEKSYEQNVFPGAVTNVGAVYESADRNVINSSYGFSFKIQKRDGPTINFYSAALGTLGKVTNSGDKDVSSGDIGVNGIRYVAITSGVISSGVSYNWTADAEL